ncbi:ABC transporter substrate-binding protein [Methylocella sp.]|uniref:ABC transporter substrate-binding protein n=1 Tax=Methylocella sp. TaxID=1978226 RepID=UPI0037832C54
MTLSLTRRGLLALGPGAVLAGAAAAQDADPLRSPLLLRRSRDMPSSPRRIVALEFLLAETLALLDLPPVGMSDKALYPGWIGVAVDRLQAAADVGTRQQPSLEAIARLEPDLILGVAYRHAPLFDAFEAIAPTALMQFAPGRTAVTQLEAVFEMLDLIAAMAGRVPFAAPVRAASERAIEDDRARLEAARRTGGGFTLLQELGLPDTYWVFTADSMAAGIARRLGLRFWPAQRSADGVRALRSDELLGLENVDVGLVSFTDPSVTLESKTSSVVWARAPAKREGRVSLIERNIWNFGGPGSAIRLSNAMTGAVLAAPRG